MSKSKSRTSLRRRTAAGIAVGGTTALLLASTAVPAMAVAATLSHSSGPAGGGNSITVTAAATSAVPSPFPAGVVPKAEFQAITATVTTCSTSYKAAVTPAAGSASPYTLTAGVVVVPDENVMRLSATKLVLEIPSTLDLVGSNQTIAKWNLCIYNDTSTTTSALLANANYTIADQPTITAISPTSGPALGGGQLTITGTNFSTTGTTVTVGGTPATNVSVASNGASLTATIPAHAADDDLPVVVNSAGGMVSTVDPDLDGDPLTTPIAGFSYSNGIVVSPNTAAEATEAVDLDILGVGFLSMDFSDDPTTDDEAGVFLVEGAYVAGSNRGVAACADYIVISDNEVICTMDLTELLNPATSAAAVGDVAEGTYTITVVNDKGAAATSISEITSGSTFTVSDY